MWILSSCPVGAGVALAIMLIFSILGSASSFGGHTLGKTRLQTRQQPAVIAPSRLLRRAYHASTVAGQWLYIDGGQFSLLNNGTPNYLYSTTILSIDLSQNWTNSTVVIQSTIKPSGAPNLNGPSLWYDESRELFYSGFLGQSSSFDIDSHPQPPPLSLWTFQPDNTGSGTWNELFSPTATVWGDINRLSLPCMASDSDTVYILGGYVHQLGADVNDSGTALAREVRFDIRNQTFVNSTIENGVNFTDGRGRGAMHFVPAFGREGIFVTMGGEDSFKNLVGFGSVLIFDPSTQYWYNQTTTGSPPSPRLNFCIAGISSTNNTYEIFVYAGNPGHLGTPSISFDSINILTIPAFHWLSVPYDPQNPRSGHTCNAVGGSQILIVGGIDNNAPIDYGDYEKIAKSTFSTPDPFKQGLAIFDLQTWTFAEKFIAGLPPQYEQSNQVKQYYGQSLPPYTQNLSPAVATLLKTTHFSNTNTSITPSPPLSPIPSPPPTRKANVGAIAGGAIGGVAASCFLAVSLLVLAKSKRNKYQSVKRGETQAGLTEQDSDQQRAPGIQYKSPPKELSGQGAQELDSGVIPLGELAAA